MGLSSFNFVTTRHICLAKQDLAKQDLAKQAYVENAIYRKIKVFTVLRLGKTRLSRNVLFRTCLRPQWTKQSILSAKRTRATCNQPVCKIIVRQLK
jgi:hypothetical protein